MNSPRMILIFASILAVYGGANAYIARRLYQWLQILSLNISAKVFVVVFVLIAVSLFLGFVPFPMSLKRIFAFIGAYWTGIFVYLLIFTLLSDITMLLGSLTRLVPSPTPQSLLFWKGMAVVLLTTGFVCYGMFSAGQIRIVSYEIELRDASLDGLKIVLISDTHFGSINNTEKNLNKIVEEINGLNPDIVCLTGDIFNDDIGAIRDPAGAIALLSRIESTYGVFACLGNHDGGSTFPQMMEFLEESNIRLLKDEHVFIDGRLVLFGRLDERPIGGFGELRRQDISETIVSVGAELPVVVMEHDPAHIGEYGSEVSLILAGHTHNGQVFPGMFITRAMYAADYGHFQKDSKSPHVIITSGVSTWGPPMRVGTNNEIVSITLR